MALEGHTEEVSAIQFAPDMRYILSMSLYDGSIRFWNVLTGNELRERSFSSIFLACLDFRADAEAIVSGSFDGSLSIWSSDDSTELFRLGKDPEVPTVINGEVQHDYHADAITCCRFSPDGKIVASTSFDGTVKLWNAIVGTLMVTVRRHEGPVRTCTFSRDGRLFSAGDDAVIRISIAGTFDDGGCIEGHKGPINGLSFGSSGQFLFSASDDRTLRCFTFSGTWVQIALFAAPCPLRCVAASPQEGEEELTTGGADGQVFLLRLYLPGEW